MARQRVRAAEALYNARHYDDCTYICGYAVEFVLKARICRILNVDEYPADRLKGVYKTHNLNDLLFLSGQETKITDAASKYKQDWDIVLQWNTEDRYKAIGLKTQARALEMIQSCKVLMRVL